ncbi:MAG: ribonuclease P protein subunit [Thermoproteota archaeon]|jgi:ribonuclease P protein subunit POP4|nr:ribonuclease P protein subunit [Thermoproteota archaeon]
MIARYENILSRGIVGFQAEIIQSSDPTLHGMVGTIVFETKNMIFIRSGSIVRRIAKMAAKRLRLQTAYCACFISGSALIGRPEDRISRLNNE